MATHSFPTLGEISKFLFDATGILARKGDKKNAVIEDEKRKKSIQTALNRLSEEKGDVEKIFYELLNIFFECVHSISCSDRITGAISESLYEVFEQYLDLVKREGTYLPKKNTLQWAIRGRFLSRAVLSPYKNLARFNISILGLSSPEDRFWFLPSIENNKIISPLSKALRWTYQITETSQTNFHYPNKAVDLGKTSTSCSVNYRLNQNLENASKWLNGRSFPTWSAIASNLNDSFTALEECDDPCIQKEIEPQIKQSITLILFISRFTTFIFQQIEKSFGEQYLHDLLGLYKKYSLYLDQDNQIMKTGIEHTLSIKNISDPDEIDAIWYEEVPDYWKFKAHQATYLANKIDSFYRNKFQSAIPGEIINPLIKEYGSFLVMQYIDTLEYQKTIKVPQHFPELLMKGMEIKNNSKLQEHEITAYESELKNANLDNALAWLSLWVRANSCYREEDHQSAYLYYKKAFDEAKYTAGIHQYKLVNQYIESCAKVDKWRDFKKGVAWANYLDIEVRWLRGMGDQSDESLKTVFAMFKESYYPVL